MAYRPFQAKAAPINIVNPHHNGIDPRISPSPKRGSRSGKADAEPQRGDTESDAVTPCR
jgi:hypothetical protein